MIHLFYVNPLHLLLYLNSVCSTLAGQVFYDSKKCFLLLPTETFIYISVI
jgi:hypothetical protein